MSCLRVMLKNCFMYVLFLGWIIVNNYYQAVLKPPLKGFS